jgi:hypothetical protein
VGERGLWADLAAGVQRHQAVLLAADGDALDLPPVHLGERLLDGRRAALRAGSSFLAPGSAGIKSVPSGAAQGGKVVLGRGAWARGRTSTQVEGACSALPGTLLSMIP